MLTRIVAAVLSLFACAFVPIAYGQALARNAPVLLVATPGLQDPNFAHTVVLVVFPPDGGPTGVILNRPTRLKWPDAFPDEPALVRRADPIFFGGPVQLNVLWYLFHRATPPETALPIVEDLYLSADGKLLDRLLAVQGKVERFFIGYSGWSPSQLEVEIASGAWYVLPADLKTILELQPDTMWQELLRRATAVEA